MNTFSFLFLVAFAHSALLTHGQNFNRSEVAALKQFRQHVENFLYLDYMKSDKFLIRWLRARNLNVERANSMLRKALRWKKVNKVHLNLNETILDFQPPLIYVDSFAYSVSPIAIFNVRSYNVRDLAFLGKRNELIRYFVQIFETGESAIQYLDKRFPLHGISHAYMIFDTSGYNRRQHGCLSCLVMHYEIVRIYENYYPALAKEIFVVNAPPILIPLIELIKPALSSQTRKALKIFGTNRREWRPVLLKLAPPNQFRKELGGTRPEQVLCQQYDFTCHCKQIFRENPTSSNFGRMRYSNFSVYHSDICL